MRFDKGKKEIQVNFALIRRCGGTFPRGGRLGAECLPLRGKVAEAPPEVGGGPTYRKPPT